MRHFRSKAALQVHKMMGDQQIYTHCYCHLIIVCSHRLASIGYVRRAIHHGNGRGPSAWPSGRRYASLEEVELPAWGKTEK